MEYVQAYAEAMPWQRRRRAGFVAVMRALSQVADHATGRDVAISARTIGQRVGLSRATVFRRMVDAREARMLETVETGRHLTSAERAEAYTATGRRIVAKGSIRALHEPPPEPGIETPPRPSGRRSTPERRQPTTTRAPHAKRQPRPQQQPRPLWIQHLAAHIDARLPWLNPHRHIGNLATALHRAGIDHTWTPTDVIDALDHWHRTHHATNEGRAARNPLGWLVAIIKRAICEGYRPHSERRRAEAAERDRRRKERAWEAKTGQEARRKALAAEPEGGWAAYGARLAAEARAARLAAGEVLAVDRYRLDRERRERQCLEVRESG